MSTARFSVIIPTYQRPDSLRATLQALSALQPPRGGFEVIVVSDGGADDVEALLAPFCSVLDLAILQQPHRGPAAARNAGASRARGEYLAFTDDDCLPAADWLCALDARLTPECAVGGASLNALPQNLYAATSDLLLRYLFAYYNAEPALAQFLSTNNLAVSAARFQSVGGFALDFEHAAGEDREFCSRWRAHGYSLRFAPEIVVRHAHALTAAAFWQQHLNYGRGAFHVRRAQARRAGARIRFEPATFYWQLCRAPFKDEHGARAWQMALLLLAVQCANAAGLALEFARARNRRAARRPEVL
ncbi:MAG TPA: glycosyltransferase [Chloroflexota bacterium]|nr:glycosyltransferase [Chloroflexota bacterium]